MRVVSVLSIGVCCAAFALPANAGVVVGTHGPAAGKAIITIADRCPPGLQWVPAGYAAKGKWKDGHCSTWSSGSSMPYGYGAGYSQPATPYGYGGGYGQPSPTAGMPGAWQPSASSHPASDDGQP
jgi:hypothetical protein